MLSRLTATLAEKARNRFAEGASRHLWESVEARLEDHGPWDPAERISLPTAQGAPLQVSRLALGTGSDGWMGSSNQTRKLGVQGLARLLLEGLHEHNLNHWDTADQYGSHPHVAEALRQVGREQVVVLTKTVAESPAQVRRDLDRFRKELGTETIDILLLHCMTDADWPRRMRGVMEAISEAQQAGVVRLKGVSCHSFSALKAAVSEPWVELDLARINPGGKCMDASPDRVVPVLRDLKEAGKTVMGMKIYGNGRLADERESCLQFALGLDCLDCLTIGFESPEQLRQTIRTIRSL